MKENTALVALPWFIGKKVYDEEKYHIGPSKLTESLIYLIDYPVFIAEKHINY